MCFNWRTPKSIFDNVTEFAMYKSKVCVWPFEIRPIYTVWNLFIWTGTITLSIMFLKEKNHIAYIYIKKNQFINVEVFMEILNYSTDRFVCKVGYSNEWNWLYMNIFVTYSSFSLLVFLMIKLPQSVLKGIQHVWTRRIPRKKNIFSYHNKTC